MKLPNLENAVVSKAKVLDYLLANTSKSARAKAGFFARFGFTRDNWRTLQLTLLEHCQTGEVESVETDTFGERYTVVGELKCPDGRSPTVKAVWMVDEGQDVPRLITAYPSKRRWHDELNGGDVL